MAINRAFRSPSRQPNSLPTVPEVCTPSTAQRPCGSAAVSGGSPVHDIYQTGCNSPASIEAWATPARSTGRRGASNARETRDDCEASPSDSDRSTAESCPGPRLQKSIHHSSRRQLSARSRIINTDDSLQSSGACGSVRVKPKSATRRQSERSAPNAPTASEATDIFLACPHGNLSANDSNSASLRSMSAPARTQDRLTRQRSRSGSRHSDGQQSQDQTLACVHEKRSPRVVLLGKENVRPSLPAGEVVRESLNGSSREASAVRAASVQPRNSFDRNVLPCNRARKNDSRHAAAARGPAAREAFREALVSGAQRPTSVKLGFVGAARAGKTSTLRALAGLPLRANEESTPGLAVWEVAHTLLSAGRRGKWHLQKPQDAGIARWDHDIAQYVADRVQPPDESKSSSSFSRCTSAGCEPDESVMKKMPVDLIAHRLGKHGADEEKRVVLETYDFGGQEVYYAMHHLFLTDNGIYLACLDLTTVQSTTPDGTTEGVGDFMDDAGATAKEHGWEALEWWLASISISAPNSPIALVGTHDDCLEQSMRSRVHQLVHQRIVRLCTRIPELNVRLKVNEVDQLCFFPVDNSLTNARTTSTLQHAIDEMASDLLSGTLSEPIPLRWAHFWSALQRATSDDRLGPLCPTEDLWKRCSHYAFESRDELTRFLHHFKGIGVLMHFPKASSESHRDLVCLDPAWIAEAAACVLVAKDRVLQGCTRHSAELRENGRLHSELLAAIWRPRTFARHQRPLVELLQVLDLLMLWGQDKVSMPQSQHATAHQVYLVPSLLPLKPRKPVGELRVDLPEDDSVVMFLDFHGLLHRLLPTLFPRVLCAMARNEAAIQILSVYANYATFALSTQGQAHGDSARSLGGRRQVQKLIVHLQPCAGGEFLRCCMRPHRGSSAGMSEGIRPSWRHADRLLHSLRDAMATWMPRLSFKVGVKCPACMAGRSHTVDLHSVLQDDVALCTRSGEPIEDLPCWLADWRSHIRPPSPEPVAQSPREFEISSTSTVTTANGDFRPDQATSGLELEYLYAAPLDAAALDIRAELDVIASLPGLINVNVRTATTEVLTEVWRAGAISTSEKRTALRVLRLATHCAVDPSGHSPCATIILEDAIGRSHAVTENDLAELLVTSPTHAPLMRPPFDVIIFDACNSERLARCFVKAGAPFAIACAGTVFDAAARAFLRTFLRALATEGDNVTAAFAVAQRAVRLSPQPGLRAESDRFKLLCADDDVALGVGVSVENWQTKIAPSPPLPPPQPPQSQASVGDRIVVPAYSLPLPVEDFTGRTRSLAEIAQSFFNGRRVIWLHGKAGIGKSCLATEFVRFYGFPGDRLFSPPCNMTRKSIATCVDSPDSMPIVQFTGLPAVTAISRLQAVLLSAETRSATYSRPVLVVLDDVCCASSDWWKLLDAALGTNQHLRLLLTSRQPRYDAPLSCKIVANEVGALAPEDAALLFLRRIHRPLFQRDFNAEETTSTAAENSSSGAGCDAPLSMLGRRREFLQQLSRHPLLVAVGYEPGATIDAAMKVTPLLPSLHMHPVLLAPKVTEPALDVVGTNDILPHAAGGA